jgi:Ca-activated chloride channel family protein
VALIFSIIVMRNRNRLIARLAHKDHQSSLVHGYSLKRDVIHGILRIGALLFVALALLDPRGKSHEIDTVQKSKDVMFIVDISRSMLAEDLQPSRLEAVKSTIKNFVHSQNDFAYGLTIFSTKALTLCPITHEKSTFFMFLNDISHKTVTAGGTSLKAALEHIATMYEQEGMQGAHTCVLFTDGEDFSGDLSEITARLSAHNVKICLVGVGSDVGAPIPFYNTKGIRQGHIKDNQGSIVISRRDDATLSSLAQSLNGIYLPFDTTSDDQLKKWLHDTTKTQETKSKSAHYDSYAYGAAIVAWLLFFIDWLIP